MSPSAEHFESITVELFPDKNCTYTNDKYDDPKLSSETDHRINANDKYTVRRTKKQRASMKNKGQPKVLEMIERRAAERSIKMKALQQRYVQKNGIDDNIQNASAQVLQKSESDTQRAEKLKRRELAREKWRLASLHFNVSLIKRMLKIWLGALERWKVQLKKVRKQKECVNFSWCNTVYIDFAMNFLPPSIPSFHYS
jgi:hypothetical protein